MAENTKIEWATHTFNPWVGCTKVSPACDNCYAEMWAKRSGMVEWGPKADRRRTTENNWRTPIKWNSEAGRLGIRSRVFCSSLADVFDNAVPVQWRIALMKLICETPNLDWLLLTKRIGNASEMLETAFRAVHHQREGWADNTLPNVWIGATICNQEEADRDIPKLLAVPAAKRFLSIEPLLGPVNLHHALWEPGFIDRDGSILRQRKALHWVIVGGESGHGARPMHPDWATSLRDQCTAAGVPFLFKQWGEWTPGENVQSMRGTVQTVILRSDGWRQEPVNLATDGGHIDDEPDLYRVGKKEAGRFLDGRIWDEVPT